MPVIRDELKKHVPIIRVDDEDAATARIETYLDWIVVAPRDEVERRAATGRNQIVGREEGEFRRDEAETTVWLGLMRPNQKACDGS